MAAIRSTAAPHGIHTTRIDASLHGRCREAAEADTLHTRSTPRDLTKEAVRRTGTQADTHRGGLAHRRTRTQADSRHTGSTPHDLQSHHIMKLALAVTPHTHARRSQRGAQSSQERHLAIPSQRMQTRAHSTHDPHCDAERCTDSTHHPHIAVPSRGSQRRAQTPHDPHDAATPRWMQRRVLSIHDPHHTTCSHITNVAESAHRAHDPHHPLPSRPHQNDTIETSPR